MDTNEIDDIWWKHTDNKKDYHINQETFRREYFGEFPRKTFLDWIEEFIIQLEDVDEPNHIFHEDVSEHFKKVGAYETQKLICEKLKYAAKYERFRLEKENQEK